MSLKDIEYMVKQLLKVGRPNFAFFVAEIHILKLPSKLLMNMLSYLTKKHKDNWKRPDYYIIENVLMPYIKIQLN